MFVCTCVIMVFVCIHCDRRNGSEMTGKWFPLKSVRSASTNQRQFSLLYFAKPLVDQLCFFAEMFNYLF